LRFYELLDLDSGNMINTFSTEAATLEAVRKLLELNGDDYANDLAYGWADDEDEEAGEAIAQGAALLERVRALAPQT
jgi:hypothetical protein